MARLHMDQCISRAVSERLRRYNHDVMTAWQLDMKYASDDVHLLTAATAGRILVTVNMDDFFLLHHAWRRWANDWGIVRAHAGILALHVKEPRLDIAGVVDTFLRTAPPLPNELYLWKGGWTNPQP